MTSLKTNQVSKFYGGTQALKKVSLEIKLGEVHALCGENGAGKSTLIKILSGVIQPEEGHVDWNGQNLAHQNVHSIESMGIATVHQEPVVFPHLNAVDNLFAGREQSLPWGIWLKKAYMRKEAKRILRSLGEELCLFTPVGDFSLAQRQMVSIARALLNKCQILILDEPTASLTARESEALFKIIGSLKKKGVGILYVSHRLEEIFRLADHVSILRDGELVSNQPVDQVSREILIQGMVGRKIDQQDNDSNINEVKRADSPVLELRKVSKAGYYNDIHLKIHEGEILGMSGLVGAGRSEIARAIFGIDAYDSGEIFFCGQKLRNHNVRQSIELGIAMVPEDRQHQGLVLPLSVATNLLLPNLNLFQKVSGLDQPAIRASSGSLISKLGIKTETPTNKANSLSGGNQQKIVIGKWMHRNPKLFILDEPTRGVDVGAKSEVHRLIREMVAQGTSVLLISSELPEILSLSHRIIVLSEGRIKGILNREEATQEKLLKMALPTEESISA